MGMYILLEFKSFRWTKLIAGFKIWYYALPVVCVCAHICYFYDILRQILKLFTSNLLSIWVCIS